MAEGEEGDYIEEPIESVPIGRMRNGRQAGDFAKGARSRARDAAQQSMSRGGEDFVGTVKRMDKGRHSLSRPVGLKADYAAGEMIPKNLAHGRPRAMILEGCHPGEGRPLFCRALRRVRDRTVSVEVLLRLSKGC